MANDVAKEGDERPALSYEHFLPNGRNLISCSFNETTLGRHCPCRQTRESAAAGTVHEASQGLEVTAAVSVLIKRHECFLWW